jgi:peptide deformylase
MFKILTSPNSLLRKVSDPVVGVDKYSPSQIVVGTPHGPMSLSVFISAMVTKMYATPDCCGLAAVQIGVPLRIMVYNPDDTDDSGTKDADKTVIMINPVIKEQSDELENEYETCLSLPGIGYNIKRNKYITVEYLDEDLKIQTLKAESWEAKIIQHEIDHLDGILYWDKLGVLKQMLMNKYRIAKRRMRRGTK